MVNPHMCDDNREPPVERHRYPRLSTWLQKEAPNFDRTRSSTSLCPTTPDNSPRHQLIPCLPCFEVESRSPIDEISFHLFLSPLFRLCFSIYIYFSSLRKERFLFDFFYFTRDSDSKSRNLSDNRLFKIVSVFQKFFNFLFSIRISLEILRETKKKKKNTSLIVNVVK